jgi:hypothetical protein
MHIAVKIEIEIEIETYRYYALLYICHVYILHMVKLKG